MKWLVASRVAVSALVAAAAVALAGCSKTDGATVRGTVTHKGVPLKTGTITFYGGGAAASAAIQPDGSYTCDDVPVGEVKVTVEQFGGGIPGGTKAGGPGMPGGRPGEKTKAPENAPPVPELAPLPATVGKQDTTPLKYNIDSKDKTINVVIP